MGAAVHPLCTCIRGAPYISHRVHTVHRVAPCVHPTFAHIRQPFSTFTLVCIRSYPFTSITSITSFNYLHPHSFTFVDFRSCSSLSLNFIHLRSPSFKPFNSTHFSRPPSFTFGYYLFTSVHLRSQSSTSVHSPSISVHFRQLPLAFIHLRSFPFIFVHFRSPSSTFRRIPSHLFTSFIQFVHDRSHLSFIIVHFCSLQFTLVRSRSLLFTVVHFCPRSFSLFHNRSPSFTCVHLRSHLRTPVRLAGSFFGKAVAPPT